MKIKMSENPSLLRSRHVVIRAREVCVLPDGRRIAPHGRYGSLHVLEHHDALRLLEVKAIKPSGEVKRHVLRQHCECMLAAERGAPALI